MARFLVDRLRDRTRAAGSAPLVTYYDLTSGERTELSATSFLNWVDKTSNLLADELMLGPGDVVDLALARSAPGHWVTLVIEAAAWQLGCTVRVGVEGPADLLVLGPNWADADRTAAGAVLGCSLHPLGLGFSSPLPPDVLDFSLEVRGQPDIHAPVPRSADELAWWDADRRVSQGDLLEVASGSGPGRRLESSIDPWEAVLGGLVVPVLTGGSSVVVTGEDATQLARIKATERVDS